MTPNKFHPWIVWDHSLRNHEVIAFRGTMQECEQFLEKNGNPSELEMHKNNVIDSWENIRGGVTFKYSDGFTSSTR